MKDGGPTPILRRAPRPASVPLLVLGAFLGYLSGLPEAFGILVVLAPVAIGLGLRASRSASVRWTAPLPVLAALAWGAFRSPYGLLPELVAGGAGLAFLVWLADDPVREVGGVARAGSTLLLPAVALGIAWSSALLLPSHSATLGVAAGLLVFALVTLAFLITRPEVFDHESPESA